MLIKQYVPPVKQFDARYDKMILDCLSSKKKYNQRQIHDMICDVCRKNGMKEPSLSWVKQNVVRLTSITYGCTNGADACFLYHKPYMGLIQAENANTVWQIDGWRLPFYIKGFETMNLFYVMDVYSRKVIGSFVSKSENTTSILKGIENAVRNTGVLPAEIVSDNHSFNKTAEAEHFKEQLLNKYGVTWSVSMNPRRKSVIERSFNTFGEGFCKDKPGYLGQGIKSRRKNARPAQELIDESVKNFLSESQITLLAGRCIEEYNNYSFSSGRLSPQELYKAAVEDNTKPYKAITVSPMEIASLFIPRMELKAAKGQIAFTRGGVRYEYELDAKHFHGLNGKRWAVRYESFDEIMVFDLNTDEYICTVQRKRYAHAAVADQTEEDKILFYKHSGRLKGIENEAKKAQERIYEEGSRIDPQAPYLMNPKLTPKSDFEDYKSSAFLSEFAERHNIIPENVPEIKVKSEKCTYEPEKENRRKKKADSPFLREEKIDLASLLDY